MLRGGEPFEVLMALWWRAEAGVGWPKRPLEGLGWRGARLGWGTSGRHPKACERHRPCSVSPQEMRSRHWLETIMKARAATGTLSTLKSALVPTIKMIGQEPRQRRRKGIKMIDHHIGTKGRHGPTRIAKADADRSHLGIKRGVNICLAVAHHDG